MNQRVPNAARKQFARPPRPATLPAAGRTAAPAGGSTGSGGIRVQLPTVKEMLGPGLLGIAALGTLYFMSMNEATNAVWAAATCADGPQCVYWVGAGDCVNGLTGQAYTGRFYVRSATADDALISMQKQASNCRITDVSNYGPYSPTARSRQRLGKDIYDSVRN